jgi:uncharacterized protein RhaS with RHS repeats
LSGRFLSEDPIGLEGGINPYAFGNSDPINFRDPSGTCAWGALGGFVVWAVFEVGELAMGVRKSWWASLASLVSDVGVGYVTCGVGLVALPGRAGFRAAYWTARARRVLTPYPQVRDVMIGLVGGAASEVFDFVEGMGTRRGAGGGGAGGALAPESSGPGPGSTRSRGSVGPWDYGAGYRGGPLAGGVACERGEIAWAGGRVVFFDCQGHLIVFNYSDATVEPF